MKLTHSVPCLFSLMLLFGISINGHAQVQVEVFTDMPMQLGSVLGIDVIHYDLSAPEKVKSKYLPALPGDVGLASQIMKNYLASPQGQEFKAVIREAYRGHEKMVRYQLEKIPAVVFEQGHYVVYGITDVQKALALYNAHRNQRALP